MPRPDSLQWDGSNEAGRATARLFHARGSGRAVEWILLAGEWPLLMDEWIWLIGEWPPLIEKWILLIGEWPPLVDEWIFLMGE